MLIISTQCFAPSTGGIETLIFSLAKNLHASGVETLVFADDTGALGQEEFDRSLPFDVRRYSGFKPLRRRRKAADIKRLCNRPDTSCSLLADSWKSIEHIEAACFDKIVCLAHGSEIPKHPAAGKRSRIQRAYSRASLIIANSGYTARLLPPLIADAKKVSVIHPGIDRPQTDPQLQEEVSRELRGYGPKLITVARLEKRKNHLAIIHAMPDLLRTYTDLLYVVIGDGPELNRLKAACSKLKIEPHVMFTGRLDGAEKNAYLANCDLFVMPGKIVGEDVEGFGIAYIEAGYFGLPGIASDSGGAGEAILDGKTGMMCDPGNAGELDDRIRTLLDSPELRQTLGQQARQRAMEFLWEKKIREYREALE